MRGKWFLAGLLVAACSGGEEEKTPQEPGPSLPLAVGNWWEYTGSDSTVDTLEVVGETQYEGREAYLLVGELLSMAGDTGADTTIAFLDGGFYNLLTEYPVLYDTLRVVIRLVPERLGDQTSWMALDYYASVYLPPPWDTTHPYTVHLLMDATDQGQEEVTVPAGVFQSHRIQYASRVDIEDSPLIMDTAWLWFSPGVGVVMSRYAEGAVPDTDSIRVLSDYHLVQ